MTEPIVRIKGRKAGPFFNRHPWVLESAVERVDPAPTDGDVVQVVADNGDFIAFGIWNGASRIRVRLYSWNREERIDPAWLDARIGAAIDSRVRLNLSRPEGACRLINSEADGLSGLIVDRFADHVVVQPTSIGMWRRLDTIAESLLRRTSAASVSVDLDETTVKREGIQAPVVPHWGTVPEGPVSIVEHGLTYEVAIGSGQKTGFYLDQRANRRVAAEYLSGRRVADVCCYTGGFSLCADRWGQATEVIGVDTSAAAIAQAERHARANECGRCRFERGDCFQWLDAAVERGERFQAVILDPPKFAAGRRGLAAAMRAYHRLNLQAIRLLDAGGILVTCSCTGSLSRDEFVDVLHGVAVRAGRPIRILESRGAAADHPVGTHCRENEYLKCLICEVG